MSHSPLRKLLNPLFPLLNMIPDETNRQFLRFKDLYYSAFETREAQEPELAKDPARRKDQFYWLLNGTDPETGHKIPRVDLREESSVLIVAGADTSANALASLVFYMARNPNYQHRVAEELRRTFENIEQIKSGPKLQSCKLLQACIDETLRMSPNAGGMIPREVLKGGLDLTIDGKSTHLSEGTEIGITLYSFHHSPVTHPYYPDTFLPDRWIPGNRLMNNVDGPVITAEDVSRERAGFQPFSTGARGCIGKQLALAEMYIAVGRLFWEFELREVEGWRKREKWTERWPEEMYPVKDRFVGERFGPYVQLKRRMMES
ncbi:MAG: hypothetical protein Q9227_006925 [Pyrenula ochraceoflavens]